jgi:hypothetical protein
MVLACWRCPVPASTAATLARAIACQYGIVVARAMLARHPGLPVASIVLLSPIVDPGQPSYTPGPDGPSVPGDALSELNDMVGSMSPPGRPAPATLGKPVLNPC